MEHYHANNIGKGIPYKVVRSGIDMQQFFAHASISESDKEALKAELNISLATKVICNVGRFSFSKAQRYTIECFALLKKDFPESKLILIGEGEMLDDCKRLCVDLGIANDVIFRGFTKDVPLYLSISNLFLFTSLREGLPRVIVEAALMKVPVAAFEVEGIREVIENEVSGIIVPQYDINALYDGAKKILNSPQLAETFAGKAFQHVRNEWDAMKMGTAIKQIYEAVQKNRVR
jgi:glycosyltransferase involved in cell wall biosynthesis